MADWEPRDERSHCIPHCQQAYRIQMRKPRVERSHCFLHRRSVAILASELAKTISWWRWLWVRWHGQRAPVVEPWQARARVVVLWRIVVETHHPQNEELHLRALHQATRRVE